MTSLKLFTKHRHLVILLFVGIAFFIVYSWYFTNISAQFTSPDETANYFFINLFAEQNEIKFHESLNDQIGGILHPRSMRVVGGDTVPGSFLGMIVLYGAVAKIFSTKVILFLTPFFAVAGVLFFYLLIKRIFDKRIAFISSLLMFVLTPFWYYSSRGMFHNILFLSLLIAGLYFLVRAFDSSFRSKSSYLFFITSGLFIGASLTVRTSEIMWVGLIITSFFIIKRKKINWKFLLLFIASMILVALPFLAYNNELFGSPLTVAYSENSQDSSTASSVSDYQSNALFLKLRNLFLPFGFDGERIMNVTYTYIVTIVPWFSILFFLGLFFTIRRSFGSFINKYIHKIKLENSTFSGQSIYVILYLTVSIWLIIYYGSFEFYENIDRTQTILGSSYLRYWLPIYIFGLPFCAIALLRISKLFQKRQMGNIVVMLFISLFYIFSAQQVLLDPLHGLNQLKKNNFESISKELILSKKINEDAIIVSGFADKVFFPGHRVIISLPDSDEKLSNIIASILNETSLYYFYSPLDGSSEKFKNNLKKNRFILREVHSFLSTGEKFYQIQ